MPDYNGPDAFRANDPESWARVRTVDSPIFNDMGGSSMFEGPGYAGENRHDFDVGGPPMTRRSEYVGGLPESDNLPAQRDKLAWSGHAFGAKVVNILI